MSETPKDTSSAAEGQADHLPEGYLPGIEQLATTVIASFIAKHGPAVGGAMYKALKGDDVLFVQIEKSWKDADYYYIALKFRNLIEHGVYLEDIYVLVPNDAPLAVFKSGRNSMDFSNEDATWVVPSELLPRLLPAEADSAKQLLLRIPDFTREGYGEKALAKLNSITLGYQFSRLDKPGPDLKKDIVIRLRKSTNLS
ncbi:hypothetical protein SAMN05216315_10549 [Nitrosospira sp. Nsp18]|jgi:hypothetical protein|uniref:hypothetical protein n=1 Tax=Nitrosospira sp. Nsp18 TaxID=1855334 RepID=UPI00088537E2|nr:hypothetical protein [Nitrosospira sp. Nsp18]SDA14474.1 hypothetical protein SAMN05216315_10549 [Nitrosospira sp. Nsp18]